MAAPPSGPGEPITSKAQMIEYFAAGAKPKAEWRIGTEHEKFGFTWSDLRPMPYDGQSGIRALLEGLTRFGWEPIIENGRPIGLTRKGCSITLEPGGQFELSGAPLETLHETCDEVHTHLHQVKVVGEELGIGMLGTGFRPLWTREETQWMPKGRYRIMRDYMPKRGNLGIDMMTRTCTVQTNLDFSSEADMVKKLRVGLALQPIATALFANSPFVEGKPTDYLSYRSHVWSDTDPDRCGMMPEVFEDGFGFERYVDWLLDVPMYFVYRDGAYLDVAGQSFRDFLKGKLPGRPGDTPFMGDWVDHSTTVFPEVRLKRYIEMRGADGGPWERLCALPALWTGLLYDDSALAAAWDLCKDWTEAERGTLRSDVTRQALHARIRDTSVRDLAREVIAIARSGLEARNRRNKSDQNETIFLAPLQQAVDADQCPAEWLLEQFNGPWAGDMRRVYQDCAY
ncbi:MAG: glutamate--cysteine ligase [Alphaproteobacteria bacterium]